MYSSNDTLLLDAPVVRGTLPARDRTRDLARIMRHALKAGAAAGPLDRAIRSAARTVAPYSDADDDVDGRALVLARRMNAVMARQTMADSPGDPHRETVRG
jgi:hypothetical protein